MKVKWKDVAHLSLGLVVLLLAGLLVREASSALDDIPVLNLTATPDAGRVILSWSIDRGPAPGDLPPRTWEYRRLLVDARTQSDACSSSSWPWARVPDHEKWQPIETPTIDKKLMSHIVEELADGRIYAFCVRKTDTSPRAYSREVLVAVPPLSAAQIASIERRLALLEARHAGPCAGQPLTELGTLRFDAGSSTLPPSDAQLARQNATQWAAIGRRLDAKSGGRVLVAGYASADYPATYNLDLSERRAESVVEELQRRIESHREFLTAAFGEQHDKLASPRDDPGDRRVQVHWCSDAG